MNRTIHPHGRCAVDLENVQEKNRLNQISHEKSRANNWPTHFMIKFAVIQLDLAQVLHKQIRDNWRATLTAGKSCTSDQDGERSQKIATGAKSFGNKCLPELSSSVTLSASILGPSKIHIRMCRALYALIAIKFVMIRLIASGKLGEHLNWIDCYLWGRLRFPGKANKIGNEIELGFVVVCILYRLYLAWLANSEKLHFPSLEFLLRDRWVHQQSEDASNRAVKDQETTIQALNKVANLSLTSPLLSVESGRGMANNWIPRPNRNLETWLKLNRFCKWSFYCSIAIVALVFASSPKTLAGSIVTDFGYELAYPTCVAWIREQQVSANNSTELTRHIYRVEPTNKILAYESRIEDLPFVITISQTSPQIVREWRTYNIARIAFDIMETSTLYLELLFQCLSLAFVVLLNLYDVVLNCNHLSEQLELLIGRLKIHKDTYQLKQQDSESEKRRKGIASPGLYPTLSKRVSPYLRSSGQQHRSSGWFGTTTMSHINGASSVCCSSRQLVCDITRAQALIHDHFSFVRGYNHFNNYNLATLALNWTIYSIVLSVWFPSVKSREIEMEFYLIILIGSLTVLFFIVIASLVHARNIHLYRQITRLMALDNTTAMTKLRWTSLMRFYFPKPLFCFTLYGATGISPVFCLKLVTWVSSFIVVMANFFYTVRN